MNPALRQSIDELSAVDGFSKAILRFMLPSYAETMAAVTEDPDKFAQNTRVFINGVKTREEQTHVDRIQMFDSLIAATPEELTQIVNGIYKAIGKHPDNKKTFNETVGDMGKAALDLNPLALILKPLFSGARALDEKLGTHYDKGPTGEELLYLMAAGIATATGVGALSAGGAAAALPIALAGLTGSGLTAMAAYEMERNQQTTHPA